MNDDINCDGNSRPQRLSWIYSIKSSFGFSLTRHSSTDANVNLVLFELIYQPFHQKYIGELNMGYTCILVQNIVDILLGMDAYWYALTLNVTIVTNGLRLLNACGTSDSSS